MDRNVTINAEFRLFVIPSPSGSGYSCLGFDVADEWGRLIAKDLGVEWNDPVVGSMESYRRYEELVAQAEKRFLATGQRCKCHLHPLLDTLLGCRVEVVHNDGTKERFKVGRSTGWLPVNLALPNRRSTGGTAINCTTVYKSIKVVG